MATTPFFNNELLELSQADRIITLAFQLTAGTGVNTAAYVPGNQAPQLIVEGGTGSALTAITQTACDALLRAQNGDATVNDVVVSAMFGTTAMVDNDTYAFVLNCDGQIDRTLRGWVRTTTDIAGTVALQNSRAGTTALTNVSFTGTQIYLTPAGNIAGRITFTNISAAATAGWLVFEIPVWLK